MATRKRKAPADERCVDEATTAKDSYYRNLYASEPDFRELARRDAEFAHFVQKDGRLDFTDPAATMQLTRTLLKQDFGLEIELPHDRLCPPVPNRHNYILWLKTLLDTSSYKKPGGKLCGLDIGTGASCIYPLLGTAQRPWCFVATDIDEKSLRYARKNVELNGLEERIRVVERKATDTLMPLDDLGLQSVDFAMMNPPFYASDQEMLALAEKKNRSPHSTCTGAPIEMVCDGGEVAHIGRMLQESLTLRNRVQWYTAMVGKASSLELLVEELQKNGIDNYAVSELVQGTKTRRWTLGWSFGPMRPVEAAARGIKTDWVKGLPPITRVNLLRLLDVGDVASVATRINEVIGPLELQSWVWEVQSLRGTGRARENVWGRAWRRKKQREMTGAQNQVSGSLSSTNSDDCKLGFAVIVEVGTKETSVTLRWLEGHDPALFESLGGFLRGKLQQPQADVKPGTELVNITQ